MKLNDIFLENEEQPILGNCFQHSYQYMMNNRGQNLVLVHGWVTGTAGHAAGKRYEHAWIERIENQPLPKGVENLPEEQQKVFIRTAIDVTTKERAENPEEYPAILYRSIGNAEVVAEYTRTEAMKEAIKHGHYGPWAF